MINASPRLGMLSLLLFLLYELGNTVPVNPNLVNLEARGGYFNPLLQYLSGSGISVSTTGNGFPTNIPLTRLAVSSDSGVTTLMGQYLYAINVTLGVPAQNFTVVVDTGSPNFWVVSDVCQSISCLDKKKYVPKNSTFYTPTANSNYFIYGTGLFSGNVSFDKMFLGPLSVNSQKFTRIFNITSPIVCTEILNIFLIKLIKTKEIYI